MSVYKTEADHTSISVSERKVLKSVRWGGRTGVNGHFEWEACSASRRRGTRGSESDASHCILRTRRNHQMQRILWINYGFLQQTKQILISDKLRVLPNMCIKYDI